MATNHRRAGRHAVRKQTREARQRRSERSFTIHEARALAARGWTYVYVLENIAAMATARLLARNYAPQVVWVDGRRVRVG